MTYTLIRSKILIALLIGFSSSNAMADNGQKWKEQKLEEYRYLDGLALAAGTDKSSAHHDYTKVYADYFSPFKNQELIFLEIGIFKGNSVKLWENYFKHAEMHFIDINPDQIEYFSSRSHYHFIDQTDSNALKLFAESIKSGFDIILDDGGHMMNQQITSFESLFPYVNAGGYYIIEDLHTSYWQDCGGGGSLADPKSGPHTCIGRLQNLIDDLNYTGAVTGCAGDSRVSPKLRQELNIYQDQIYSINFYKSVCVIQKK